MRPVHWARSFKSRVCDNRNGEEKSSSTGDACPDFVCVGAQKAGTSWLYNQLKLHPDFWMPPVKELHYFGTLGRPKRRNFPPCRDERDQLFFERIRELSALPYLDLQSYARLFEAKGSLLSGDITPAYSTLNDELIGRIASCFPNIKVIFLARDPVQRAWSQLSMGVRLGNIKPFDATDVDEVIRNLLNPGVLLRSYPSKIVARWRRYICPDLFRVFFFDDLKKNAAGLRRVILDFLGADPDKPSRGLSADFNGQSGSEKLPLTDHVRSALAHFFKDELKACAAELGGPARDWPARYGFSFFIFFAQLLDDFETFFWCDWVA
jgi:Sulfotransferase family